MKRVLDPRQVLFAEVDREAAGLCVGWPDWTPLFRSFGGKAGPRQAIRFRRRAKHYERAGLVTIALPEAFRGRGISHALAATLFRRYEELGLGGALYYMVNDVNERSRAFAESFGGEGRVLYHCFDKPLAAAA